MTNPATTLTCTLKVYTYGSAGDNASDLEWASHAFTTDIDGATQDSRFGEFSSFIGTKENASSVGADHTANDDTMVQEAENQGVNVWLLLSTLDKLGADALGSREFPWGSAVEAPDTNLLVRLYGSGLNSGSTLSIGVESAIYVEGESAVCPAATANCISIDTNINGDNALASETSGGLVEFTLASTAWGGNCCAADDNTCYDD